MTTVVNLRKMLHRKAWEFCTPGIVSTGNGSFVDSDKSDMIPSHDCTYYVTGASGIYNYNADQDAWLQLPNSGAAGTFASGSCGEFLALGMLGGASTSTATAGTTTTLATSRTLARTLDGCKVRVVSGAGVGYDGAVASNTLGANALITVTPASAIAFNATTVFEVYSGSLWFFNAGTAAVGFSVYDRATNAWTAKSVTGLPTAWGTDAQLVGTPGISSSFDTGTASAGAASTLTTTKTYLLNAWSNTQVRIISGTGAGQVRPVLSNTAGAASVLTVAVAWTVVPDATSVFALEGNSDALYLLGNNAVTLYKYSIAANTWATVAPVSARVAALGAGGTADWIDGVPSWTSATVNDSHFQSGAIASHNGRYIYSFRGAASSALDVFDIAQNTWYSSVAYGNQTETFTTNSCSVDLDGAIIIQKEATGRLFRFDVDKNVLEPYATNVYPQSTACSGDKMFVQAYKDGATKVKFLYTQLHGRAELLRMLDI